MSVWRPDPEAVRSIQGPLDYLEKYVFAGEASHKLRGLLHLGQVQALGCMDGLQALQCAKAGMKSIYLSGWQTAACGNDSDEMYPDLGLYSSNSVPKMIRKINNTFRRAAQIDKLKGKSGDGYLCPIVADLENGFGGKLKTFELVKSAIEEGVAGIHLEDQAVQFERKCGHLGGKIIVPTNEFVGKLKAARVAAEFCGVDTVIIARTDAMSAKYMTYSPDPVDKTCLKGPITEDGLFEITADIHLAIDRCIDYAPYADLLWVETPTPSLDDAEFIAKCIHRNFPGKWLAYNCSPSFNWSKLDEHELMKFQKTLGEFGYRYVFITLAGFHANAERMFSLALENQDSDMKGYEDLQKREDFLKCSGYTALKHQTEVGTGYFDKILQVISEDHSGLESMEGSTEKEQF